MPAPRFWPTGPRTTTVPPVMYSQQCSPAPSMTATAPELRTAKRSPARPETNSEPPVAPYSTVFPTRYGSPASLDGVGARERVALPKQIAPPNRLIKRTQPQRSQDPAHLFRDEHQVVHHHLGRPRELRAQVGPLRGDPDGTRIEVTRAHHDASFG